MPPLVGWAAATGGADARGADPLRDHLPLDPAPLLGAGAADLRRLRAHRGADAAGRPRRRVHPQPDPRLLARPRRLHDPAVRSPACSAASTWPPPSLLGAGFVGARRPAAAQPVQAGGPAALPELARLPLPALRARWPPTGSWPSERYSARWIALRANSNIRAGLGAAALALFVFALTFYAAILYIG